MTFVDSDDWVEHTYVEELHDKLKAYDADIAITNYYLFNEADSLFYFYITDEDYYEQVYSPAQLIEGLYETKFNKSFALISAWGKLYKRSLFDELQFSKDRLERMAFLILRPI